METNLKLRLFHKLSIQQKTRRLERGFDEI